MRYKSFLAKSCYDFYLFASIIRCAFYKQYTWLVFFFFNLTIVPRSVNYFDLINLIFVGDLLKLLINKYQWLMQMNYNIEFFVLITHFIFSLICT